MDYRKLRKSGYLPDPPKKRGETPDRVFETQLQPRLKTFFQGDVDLSPYTTETNQLNASSCAGNSTADSVEILNAVEGRPRVELSRLFVYNLARSMMDIDQDGCGDINYDDGTYIRLAFSVLSKFGICEESDWPYDLRRNLYRLPSIIAMRRATGHRIHSYYRITAKGEERCDEIIKALRARHPVVFGTTIADDFSKLRTEGPVSHPTKNLNGGHAMVCVGYLRGKGFIIKNSWGRTWGSDGFCIFTPDYMSWSKTRDIWVPTLGTTFRK
jgi:C1A family cysteine protease